MIGSQWIDTSKIFLAYVESVDKTTGLCSLSHFRVNDTTKNTIIAQPYAGRGWGIFTGVEPGSVAVCGHDLNNKIFIISFLPDTLYYTDSFYTKETVSYDEYAYPRPQIGEIFLQSKKNAKLVLNSVGDAILSDPHGNRIVIDAATDTILQQSAQHEVFCEASALVAGSIKRDIRSEKEKTEAPLVGSAASFGFALDSDQEYIGFDPTFKPEANPAIDEKILGGSEASGLSRTDIDKSFSAMPPGLADLRLGNSGPFNYKTDMVNPVLSEVAALFYEFSDSSTGADVQKVSKDKKAVGKFDNNILGRMTIGTVVNELGKTLRFDYGFNDGKVGHANIWKTVGLGVHEDGQSTDDFYDADNTLKSPKAGRSDQSQWTVDKFTLVDTATMFDFTLRTRGVFNDGKQESDTSTGPKWTLKIAKDGLTKLNIPAATSIDGKEPWREGRSLLANFDGSVEASIGKQYCTATLGLDRITGVTNPATNFVNMNGYPYYGRKDRSLTLDLEGNCEVLIGRDENTGQGLMIESDGSLSAVFGKEIVTSSSTGASTTLAPGSGTPVSSACLSSDRSDRSITIRALGNAELHLGKDNNKQQSLMISTEGGNRLTMGKDARSRSLDLHSTGGVRLEVQGPMKGRGAFGAQIGFALELDLEGNLHIYVNGSTHLHSTGDMKLQTDKDFHFESVGNAFWKIGGNCDWTIGGNKTENITGNIGVKSIGDYQIFAKGNYFVSTSGLYSMQSVALIALDAPALAINAGASRPAIVPPSLLPLPMFTSSRETAPVAVEVSMTNTTRTTRTTQVVSKLATRQILSETIEDTSNRFIDPFA